MSTPIDFSTFAMNRLKISKLRKADLVAPVYNLLKETCKSCVELENNMEECYCDLYDHPEGNRYPYDLSEPLPLQESQGRLTVLADFFFNNDLEYLRGGSTDRKYTTSITKIKVVKYDVEGIEDMVPKFYGYVINRVSRHDVYSTIKILSVTSVTVDEWYGYGHLKEIVMRRSDKKLYKFMEGDFSQLHLNDIEDMLLLVAQNKLNNLDGYVIFHLAMGLHMHTRRIFIQSRVEDLQLRFDTLDQMLKNLRLGYNKGMKRRKWIATDQKQTRIMIKDINQLSLHERIMRSLEKFVGGRGYGTDYRLL
nr:hypothetical protein [Tanacetum cinerariifolium]